MKKTNLEVVDKICQILDKLVPKETSYKKQITFVTDRLGYDRHYAIDATKIKSGLNWTPLETFESGIRKTVEWFLKSKVWVENIKTKC